MSAFAPPTGTPAAGSASTPAGNDVSTADLGQMNGPAPANAQADTSGDGMAMGQLQPAYSPPGQQAPPAMHNYTPTGTPGHYAHHAPGEMAPAHRPNISTMHGVSHTGLGKAIAHLRGSSKGGTTEKGPHPSAGNKSAGLKSNGQAKAPTKK